MLFLTDWHCGVWCVGSVKLLPDLEVEHTPLRAVQLEGASGDGTEPFSSKNEHLAPG